MSADEDTELRDLVAQSLESNGVLGKIRAQLRASIFLALEEQESVQNKTPFLNQSLKKFTSTKEGCLVVGLIREFLAFFSLEFTQSVFEPEVGLHSDQYESRSDLAREFNVIESEESSKLPLLAEVIRRGSEGGRSRVRSSTENDRKDTKKSSGGDIVNGDSLTYAKKPSKSPPSNQAKDTFFGFDNDDDSFFDDPLPSNDKSQTLQSKGKEEKKEVQFNDKPLSGKSGNQTSLVGLPSLGQSKSGDQEDFKDIDQKLAGLGMDIQNNDFEYDEDFESSNLSPLGITPRSARSDHNVKSIEEEIEEDIEDLSVAEDLLRDDHSGADELTTDRTISPTDQTSGAFDYMEDVMSP